MRRFHAFVCWVATVVREYQVLIVYAAVVLFCVFGAQWVVWAAIHASKGMSR